MITASYRELFAVIAETSATLTGLLFVAISLATSSETNAQDLVIQEIRAAAAYLAFVNALVVSIFALVPSTNIGYPTTVLGVTGVLFTAAAVHTLTERRLPIRQGVSQIGLLSLLLVVFGLEIDAGIRLILNQNETSLLDRLSYLLLISIVIGVARAWELVGRRQTGLFSSMGVLLRRNRPTP
jgi:hypothetical protein